MSHIGKRRRTEEDEETSNKAELNGLVRRQNSKIPAVLEESIFGVQPINDFVRVVGDFLYSHVGKENIEIEAKLGVLLDKQTHERIKLPVYCETIIKPNEDNWMLFESNMTLEQHKHFNETLNKRFAETNCSTYKGRHIEYKHTYETDRFYNVESGKKIRVTRNQKTGDIIEGGIVEKIRVANLNIYSPNTKLDYRISVNIENPKEMPKGIHSYERSKDRLSYTHQIIKIDLTQVKGSDVPTYHAGAKGSQDLTHELEVEFIDPSILSEEKLKIEKNQESRYLCIVEHFLNNIRMLAKNVL